MSPRAAPSTPGGKDGYGLAKIVAKHPEVLERLPELLAEMEVRSLSPNRIILESGAFKAAVSLNWKETEKRWLLSAYAKAAPETADYLRAASEGQADSPDAGRGDKIGDPAAGGNAGETFDPTPHLPAARQYLAGNGSLRPEAVGRALGLPPAEAERVLGALAARQDGGLFISRRGNVRRLPRIRGPEDVIDFLNRRGGLSQDNAHDLRNVGDLARSFTPQVGPLLRRRGGLSIDEAGELLAQTGYFGQRGIYDPARPSAISEADVLELLERASLARSRGERVYAPDDQFDGHLARNARSAAEANEAARLQAHADLSDELARHGYAFAPDEIDSMLGSWRSYRDTLPIDREADMDGFLDSWADSEEWVALQTARAKAAGDYDVPFDDGMEAYGRNPADTLEGTGARGADPGGGGPAPERGSAGGRTEGAGSPGATGADARGAEPDERDLGAYRAADAAGANALSDFDDPFGPGAASQAEHLTHDMRADLDGADDLEEPRMQSQTALKKPRDCAMQPTCLSQKSPLTRTRLFRSSSPTSPRRDRDWLANEGYS